MPSIISSSSHVLICQGLSDVLEAQQELDGLWNLVDKGKLYSSWSLQMMIAAGLPLPAAAMGMPGIFVFEAVSRPQKLITSRQLELTLSRRHWKKEGHHIKWSDGPNRLPPQPVGTCLRNGQTHAEHGDPDAEALLSLPCLPPQRQALLGRPFLGRRAPLLIARKHVSPYQLTWPMGRPACRAAQQQGQVCASW